MTMQPVKKSSNIESVDICFTVVSRVPYLAFELPADVRVEVATERTGGTQHQGGRNTSVFVGSLGRVELQVIDRTFGAVAQAGKRFESVSRLFHGPQ